jgi:hypothetical protein
MGCHPEPEGPKDMTLLSIACNERERLGLRENTPAECNEFNGRQIGTVGRTMMAFVS